MNIKYDHLLRLAINNKIISITLRKRLKPDLNLSKESWLIINAPIHL